MTVALGSSAARKLTFHDLRKFMTLGEIASMIDALPTQEAYKLRYDYEFWARPTQRLPKGNWRCWFLKGGRGCIAGHTRLHDPTTGLHTRVDTLAARNKPVYVQALDARGAVVVAKASAPFLKGYAELYRVTFVGGREITVTREHKFFTRDGWKRLSDVSPGVEVASGEPLELRADAQHYWQTDADLTDRCLTDRCLHGLQLQRVTDNDPVYAPLRDDVPVRTHQRYGMGAVGIELEYNHHCQQSCHQHRNSYAQSAPSLLDVECPVSPSNDVRTQHLHLESQRSRDMSFHEMSSHVRMSHRSLDQGDQRSTQRVPVSSHRATSSDVARFVATCESGMQCPERSSLAHRDRPFAAQVNVLSTTFFPPSETSPMNDIPFVGIVSIEIMGWGPYYDLQVPDFHNYLAEGVYSHNSGKTWTGANVVKKWSKTNKRMLLVGRTSYDVRDVMVLGDSGIMAVSPKQWRPVYEPSKRLLTWPNGAQALLRSADEPDSFRGPQFHKVWGDELASWRYGKETWDNIMLALRLGDDPQMVATSTPRPIKFVKDVLALPTTVVTTDSTYANIENLAESWANDIIRMYRGTRTGLQELEGRVLDDNPYALWTRKNLDETRVYQTPDLDEIVVAVDPMVADLTAKDIRNEGKIDYDTDTSETGIAVVGRVGLKGDLDSHGYTLDDMSMRGTPLEWCTQVATAFYKYKADKVVAEANNGGALVKAAIHAVAPNIPVELVHAARGKLTRAEPVSTIFAQGRGHNVGTFAELEDQLCLDGNTRILMEWGEKPIREVVAGDVVRTRYGLRSVVHAGMTQQSANVYEIRTQNDRVLIATGNHPLYSLSAGQFIPAANLKVGERLMSWESTERLSSGAVRSGTLTKTATTKATVVNCCMLRCGNLSTDLCQQDISYITKTKTNRIGTYRISKRSVVQSTLCSTTEHKTLVALSNAVRIEKSCGPKDNQHYMHAHTVGQNSGLQACEPNSVSADVVVSITPIGTRPVYNIEIDGVHEYFANGLLVHNCEWQPGMPSPDRLDAMVWGYTSLMVDAETYNITLLGD